MISIRLIICTLLECQHNPLGTQLTLSILFAFFEIKKPCCFKHFCYYYDYYEKKTLKILIKFFCIGLRASLHFLEHYTTIRCCLIFFHYNSTKLKRSNTATSTAKNYLVESCFCTRSICVPPVIFVRTVTFKYVLTKINYLPLVGYLLYFHQQFNKIIS